MTVVVDVKVHSQQLEQSHSRNLAEAQLVAGNQSGCLDKPVAVGQSLGVGLGESSIADCNCNCSHFGPLLSSHGIRADKNRKTATTAGRTVGHN